MSTRSRIKVQGKSRYIERAASGQFTDNTNLNASIRADARKRTVKRVARGHGHEGDLSGKRK